MQPQAIDLGHALPKLVSLGHALPIVLLVEALLEAERLYVLSIRDCRLHRGFEGAERCVVAMAIVLRYEAPAAQRTNAKITRAVYRPMALPLLREVKPQAIDLGHALPKLVSLGHALHVVLLVEAERLHVPGIRNGRLHRRVEGAEALRSMQEPRFEASVARLPNTDVA